MIRRQAPSSRDARRFSLRSFMSSMAGCSPGIKANIGAIGLGAEPLIEQSPHLDHELREGRLLVGREEEIHGHNPPRDHEHIPRRQRKRIEDRKAEWARGEPL